jgi:hypothetical protein
MQRFLVKYLYDHKRVFYYQREDLWKYCLVVDLLIRLFGSAYGDSALAPIGTVSFCAGVRRKRFSGKPEIATNKTNQQMTKFKNPRITAFSQ